MIYRIKGIMRKIVLFTFCIAFSAKLFSQIKWINVDSLYQPLPSSVHVYFTNQAIDTAVFRAYYLIADLKDKKLEFTADTTLNRRLTPAKFYEKNSKPLVVVNCTFFSFETNRNLNAVIKNGKLVSYNIHTVPGKGKDTFTYRHPFGSAIGISKKRKADVAWVFTDSLSNKPMASQTMWEPIKDSLQKITLNYVEGKTTVYPIPHKTSIKSASFNEWKMQTAVGGGPVLLQDGEIRITNNEELKFTGKAINDKHPRTAMGYTKDDKLIILVIQGRSESSGGASLSQEAKILKDLGCWEALNLDGGGSSCMVVNGKETIKSSDSAGQRPVPAVFIIRQK
ncbi:MAG TPA: phosphodiester glycosidase family protein [Chitinophagaceae bacterium]|jgi:exopolysaccharide biosynthesis protein|nr:phosphodiester glycosidase family protein [Chitinophagaceae bacterium]